MKRCMIFVLLAMLLCSGASAQDNQNICPVLEGSDFFPLKEPVTLTALAINTTGQIDVSGSDVQEWIEEKTNVRLEIVHELYGSEGQNLLSMMMASDEKLPDIFLCTRWTKAECALYGAKGLIIPLDEYLEDCVNWNRLNEICGPEHAEDLTMSDGHIYCFGSVNECFHLTHQARMWVYQPWIDQLCGGRIPQTTEEFYEYLQLVKTMDPNGNGVQDEIPLMGQIDSGWASDPFTYLSNAFVHNNRILGSSNQTVAAGVYLTPDGQVRCNWTEEDYREALRYMNRLFEEGLLDHRTYTQDGYQLQAHLNSDPPVLGAIASGGIPQRYLIGGALADTDYWKNWTCIAPLEGPDGLRLTYQSTYDYFYNCNGVVTRDCRYPEIAVQLFDFLCSAEGTLVQNYGKEGQRWQFVDSGEGMNGIQAFYAVEPIVGDQYGWPPDVQISANYLAFRNALRVEEGSEGDEQQMWELAELYDQYSPGVETVFPNLAYPFDEAVEITRYAAGIGGYVEKAMVQFIIGELDLDTDWQPYLSKLESMGQEQYHRLLQQAYDASLKQ